MNRIPLRTHQTQPELEIVGTMAWLHPLGWGWIAPDEENVRIPNVQGARAMVSWGLAGKFTGMFMGLVGHAGENLVLIRLGTA